MKNKRTRTRILISILIGSFGLAMGQGLYWESTTIVPAAGGNKIHSNSLYRPHMFKQGSENSTMIVRLDKEAIYQINNAKKEYSVMTFAELEAYTKKSTQKLEGKMAELTKQFEKMPPEQRKAMEQMMGKQGMTGSSNAKIDVKKTGEKKTISGYGCSHYVMTEEGKEVGSVWTTTDVPDFKSMQKDFKEFGERMAAQMPMKGGQMSAAMAKMDGFPVQTTIAGITTTVNKIEKKSPAASEFEVPVGYKKVDQRDLMEQ
jgi:GLPGLI family protein